MTTSFTLNTESAIDTAIALAGGNPSQFEELRQARINANLLFSEWQTQGVNLWKLDLIEIPVSASTVIVSVSTNVHELLDVAWRVSTSSGINDFSMERVSYDEYLDLTNKNQGSNRPTQYLVEKLLDKINLRIWQVPTQAGKLVAWGIKRIEDINSPRDSLDVPFKFLSAFVYGLAFKIYQMRFDGSEPAKAKLTFLDNQYTKYWTMATDDDTDRTSLKITPKMRN